MGSPFSNWLSSVDSQLDFHLRAAGRKRTDGDFDWRWLKGNAGVRTRLRRLANPLLSVIFPAAPAPHTRQWLKLNAERLWEVRQMLADDLSRYFFDAYLQLVCSGYQKFYFPRTDFDDLLAVRGEEPFAASLPGDYLGVPLKIFSVTMNAAPGTPELKVATTRLQLELLNRYRQYFPKRGPLDLSPRSGETVLDCGTCIGDIALLFAALVGSEGAIHLFDPVPLHARYCRLQAELNPALGRLLQINVLAVGESSSRSAGTVADAAGISPGGCKVDSFETVSLDDYVASHRLTRVDYLKMDIEGTELAALRGAQGVIARCKPRLAISAYHKPDDLWEIPAQIRKTRPDYQLYFGHHSPLNWESVFYAA